MLRLFLILALGSLMVGCKKKDEPGTFGPVPGITGVEVTPGTVRAWQDSLSFSIQYTDGDGDLGENREGAENLFIQDGNTGVTTAFRIPLLAPEGKAIRIQGSIRVGLNSVGKLGTGTETTRFKVWITDRAGNKSNEWETGAVSVLD